jgi:dipeptide/tripeptide permease
MRGKKQLRHILPVCFTVLYAVLIFATSREGQAIRNPPPPSQLVDSDLQPYHPPVAAQWALAINLPAVIASMPVLLMLWKSSPSDQITYVVIGLFVPLLWFLVGRWFDRVLGLLPAKPQSKRSLLAVLGFVTFLAVDGFVIFVMVNDEFYQLNFTMIGIVAWLAFAALCFYMRMRGDSRVAGV